jgi:hypothetical protein
VLGLVATSVVTQNAASPWNKSTPQERDVLNRVGADVESFERGIGTDWREMCNRRYQPVQRLPEVA